VSQPTISRIERNEQRLRKALNLETL
jgi:hypothetical protein